MKKRDSAKTELTRSDFLFDFFGPLSGEKLYISALANERSLAHKFNPQQIASVDPAFIDKFVGKFDVPGRGTFFCISPIRVDVGAVKSKDVVTSLRCLHADIDFKGVVGNRTSVLLALKKLKRQPTYVIASGHGLHVYYLFSMVLDANADNIAQVENAMRRLGDVVGGDPQVCEISRIMRLPGTTNSKVADDPVECKVLEATSKRYTFGDLVTWLGVQEPVVERSTPVRPSATDKAVTVPGEVNFFSEYGKREYIGETLDLDAMIEGMVYPGNVHNTERDLMASLLSRFEPVDNAIDFIVQGLQEHIPESASWDWKREIRELRSLAIGWFVKHPDLLEGQPPDLPSWLLADRRIKTKVLPHVKLVEPPEGAEAKAMDRIAPPDRPAGTGTPDRGAGKGTGARVLDWKPPHTNGTARKMDEPENETKNEDGTPSEVIDLKDRRDRVHLKSVEPKQPTPELKLRWAEDIETDPVTAPEWIVPGYVMKGALNGYFGDGGTGKDLTMMQLCGAMATGHEKGWLGMPVMPGRALYFNVEDNWQMIRYRLDAVQRYYDNLSFNDFPERWLTASMVGQSAVLAALDGRSGIVKPTPLYDNLRKLIAEIQPDLIIVGNRVNIFAVNQNEDSQARQCLELLNALILEFGCTIIMPGHVSLSGMSSDTGMSGSVQWSNGVRHRIYLSMLPRKTGKANDEDPMTDEELNTRILTVKKANWSKSGASMQVAWDDRYNLFVPIEEAEGFAAEKISPADRIKRADAEFLRMLAIYNEIDKAYVSANNRSTTNYAPKVMVKDKRCTIYYRKPHGELEDAMRRLMQQQRLTVEDYGPPSNNTKRLVEVQAFSKK